MVRPHPEDVQFLPSLTTLSVGRPSNRSMDRPEPDESLHGHDPLRNALNDLGTMSMLCGFTNIGCPAPLLAVHFLAVSSRLNAWCFSNAGRPDAWTIP